VLSGHFNAFLTAVTFQRLSLNRFSAAAAPPPLRTANIFEQTWNTGITLQDSCGYVALSHAPSLPRIIVAFRGTYSIANAIADLSLTKQEYVPYTSRGPQEKCEGCRVHSGFYESWTQTEAIIGDIVDGLVREYPDYKLTLVGHSLGGAVAALAGLDFGGRGYNPIVTTFGEPKVGNSALANFFNKVGFGGLGQRKLITQLIFGRNSLLTLTVGSRTFTIQSLSSR